MIKEEIKRINSIQNVKARKKEYRKQEKIYHNNMQFIYAFAKFLYTLNQKENNNEVHYLLNKVINNEETEEKLKVKAQIKLAQFYMSRGEYTKAENLLVSILDKNPDYYKCILTLAQLKVKTCEMDIAKKLFQYVTKSPLCKYRKKAYQNLIEFYILEEEYDQALKVIEDSKEDKKASLYENYVLFSLARIYRGKKEYDKAKEHLEKITGLNRDFGILSLEQVYLYSETNDIEKLNMAKEELKRYRKPEEKIEIESALMFIEEKNGNHEEAMMHKNKMLAIRHAYRCNKNDHFMW